jgi:hypothetical protein
VGRYPCPDNYLGMLTPEEFFRHATPLTAARFVSQMLLKTVLYS